MITYTKVENIYEVRVQSSDKLIGKFIREVDGSYYFQPTEVKLSLWSDWVLSELGRKLTELNDNSEVEQW